MEPQRQAVAESIPIWDGNPRGWRRYQREVLWYCMGQKKHAPSYCSIDGTGETFGDELESG